MSAAAAPSLSALVVARNEEERLADCLERLAFADERVVLLDRCSDGSAGIARALATRVVEGAWPLEGERRNAAIGHCRGDWIVEIDADERVSPALAEEIRATIARSPADWHLVPVDNYIGARLVRHGWGGSIGRSAHPGLFRRGAKTWGPGQVHPRITLQGQEGARLSQPLQHLFVTDLSGLLRRLDRYSSARAAELRLAGIEQGLPRVLLSGLFRFYKCYVRRKGYREGGYGFAIALFAALYPVLAHLKATLETE